jgi:hypothetical protein
MDSLLPQDNVVGKVKDKKIFNSPDWLAAKTTCDGAAAARVIDKLWTTSKTAALQAKLPSRSRDLAVISQPSTSGQNVLAFELAKKVAKELHADCYLGDDFYNALHTTQSKHIARLQRPFNPREYVAVDPHRVTQILGGKTVIVAEDILTTGSSVKHFLRALQKDGIKVSAVAALLGDRRLAVDDKTKEALIGALHQGGIDLPPERTQQLALSLTRTEARGIALLASNVRSENGREKLTRKLQGVLDQGIAPDLGRVADQRRNHGAQGKDPGYKGTPEGIQAWHFQDPATGTENWLGTPFPPIAESQNPISSTTSCLSSQNSETLPDQRLPIHQTDMRSVKRVAGRLIGTGRDKPNDKAYILIESVNGVVHRIHQSPEAMKARAAGLKPGNFIELTSTPFRTADDTTRVRVKFRSLGNADTLLANTAFLAKEVQRIVEATGTLPTEQGLGCWLGDYQRALHGTAQDLIHRGVIRSGGDGRYHFDQSVPLDRGGSVRRCSSKGPNLAR